jgi:hypothetical protein
MGIPLGTAWAELWARVPQSATARRNEQSFDEVESVRWIRALKVASQRCRDFMKMSPLDAAGEEGRTLEGNIQMSRRERNRLAVLARVKSGELTLVTALSPGQAGAAAVSA